MNWIDEEAYLDMQILEHVDITAERLFWLKVESGIEFVLMWYPEHYYEPIRDTAVFWMWFRQLNNKVNHRLLKRLQGTPGRMTSGEYARMLLPDMISYNATGRDDLDIRPNEVIEALMFNEIKQRQHAAADH